MATLNRLQLLTKPRLCSKSNSSMSTEERTWGNKTRNQQQHTAQGDTWKGGRGKEIERADSWKDDGLSFLALELLYRSHLHTLHSSSLQQHTYFLNLHVKCTTTKKLKRHKAQLPSYPASGWLIRPTLHSQHLYNTPPVLFAVYYYSLSYGSYPAIAMHMPQNLHIPQWVG